MLIEEIDKNKHNLKEIKDLLAMAVFNPTPEKLNQLLDGFYELDYHVVFVAIDDNEIIGVIGLDYTNKPFGLITHLAVIPNMRQQGVGSHLINYAVETLELATIEVETDQDVVGFYGACGFEIQEIESQYPGVSRFRCFKDFVKSK